MASPRRFRVTTQNQLCQEQRAATYEALNEEHKPRQNVSTSNTEFSQRNRNPIVAAVVILVAIEMPHTEENA